MEMSLIDTWAATGAGAFSLTENALYTVEAWTMMLDRLRDDGILTVPRWYSPDDLGETGRIGSLAVAARTAAELRGAVADAPLNYDPPTDDSPYFFNMLRLGHLMEAFRASPGVTRGNLTATLTLILLVLCLAAVCLATIILPLLLGRRTAGPANGTGMLWPGALYSSLIGAGFMLLEIGLLQRLSTFLGHPTYALGILLFTLIAGTGCGSLLSERLPLRSRRFALALPIGMSAAILAALQLLPRAMARMVSASLPARAIASIAFLFPLGLLLGTFFPCGMRLARRGSEDATPWFWALNGIFGVLCSAFAVLISIYAGISTNFLLAATCYATLVAPVHRLTQATGGQILNYPVAERVGVDEADQGVDRRPAG